MPLRTDRYRVSVIPDFKYYCIKSKEIMTSEPKTSFSTVYHAHKLYHYWAAISNVNILVVLSSFHREFGHGTYRILE